MKLSFAAAYVDESETKFLAGVKGGKWPQGIRDGGNVYWFLEDLEGALDRIKPTTPQQPITPITTTGNYLGET
jgi:hypothetical protein